MFPLSETGWRVEYETRSYLNASLQLRKQAFFQGKTLAGVFSGCGGWSKASVCLSVLNLRIHSHLCAWIRVALPWTHSYMLGTHDSIDKTGFLSLVFKKTCSLRKAALFWQGIFYSPLMHRALHFSQRDKTEAKRWPSYLLSSYYWQKSSSSQLLSDRTKLRQMRASLNGF